MYDKLLWYWEVLWKSQNCDYKTVLKTALNVFKNRSKSCRLNRVNMTVVFFLVVFWLFHGSNPTILRKKCTHKKNKWCVALPATFAEASIRCVCDRGGGRRAKKNHSFLLNYPEVAKLHTKEVFEPKITQKSSKSNDREDYTPCAPPPGKNTTIKGTTIKTH